MWCVFAVTASAKGLTTLRAQGPNNQEARVAREEAMAAKDGGKKKEAAPVEEKKDAKKGKK